MKELFNVRIPSICICYTCILVANAVYNLINGNMLNGFSSFMLQLFLFLVLCQAVDYTVSLISFRKWLHYWLTESLILFAGSLLFARAFHWMAFTAGELVYFTVVFLLTDIAVFYYFRRRQIIQADEINRLLEARTADSHEAV